jgi:peptide-methionine (S)-S-oxide reductase
MGNREIATLGGGCFWCLEAVYREVEGVLSVESGYMGGHLADPDYEAVCTGKTGHVEVVQVTFDPATIAYRDILEIFFAIHDPTTRDRQGNDAGPQYRSVVFYHDDAQRSTAKEVIRELEAETLWPSPIVTELRPATTFYRAENYHQEYFERNPQQPYCAYVVSPKVQKFRQEFASRLRHSG